MITPTMWQTIRDSELTEGQSAAVDGLTKSSICILTPTNTCLTFGHISIYMYVSVWKSFQ